MLRSALFNKYISYVQERNGTGQSAHGVRRAGAGPGNATGRRRNARSDPDPEPDVPGKVASTQIAVDYYLEIDLKKASYFQKKLNSLVVKSLSAPSIEKKQPPKETLSKKIKTEIEKFMECEKTYLQSIVENSEKSQKKIRDCVQADLDKQEQAFQGRMLKRVKSTGRL
jgi:hypothetical protein